MSVRRTVLQFRRADAQAYRHARETASSDGVGVRTGWPVPLVVVLMSIIDEEAHPVLEEERFKAEGAVAVRTVSHARCGGVAVAVAAAVHGLVAVRDDPRRLCSVGGEQVCLDPLPLGVPQLGISRQVVVDCQVVHEPVVPRIEPVQRTARFF